MGLRLSWLRFIIMIRQISVCLTSSNFFKTFNSFLDAFLEAFNQHRQQQERKIRLMHDETSEEGQRYIAELIARENIDFTHQFAMEHMPEGRR